MIKFDISEERTYAQDKQISDALYSLRPFERMKIGGGLYITAVPGGWVMETNDSDGNGWNPVFIPFTNSWQIKYKKSKIS